MVDVESSGDGSVNVNQPSYLVRGARQTRWYPLMMGIKSQAISTKELLLYWNSPMIRIIVEHCHTVRTTTTAETGAALPPLEVRLSFFRLPRHIVIQ
jgi:hypothetical protein